MAGCCIPGCTNNNKKGYSMRRFPKDVKIKPAASSVSPPLNDQSSTDCNTNSSSHDEIVEVNMEPNQQMNSIEVFTSKLPSTEVNNICEKTNSTDYETPTDCTTTSTLDEALKIAVLKAENLEKQLKVANAKLQAADVSVRKVLRSNNFLLRRIRRLRSNNRIRVEKSLLKSTEILHKVFNDDQIKWLQRDSSCKTVHKWSEETIKKHFG
ncbi:uncharacterized protein LOC143905370 [Temnothorax americanus]|uniref:uncharacterized protein LOC143905370 n=1 Tax=Temnothorax americanus TaxID=1964332 RepID=UPI0040684A5E